MLILCSCERTLPGTNLKTAYGTVDGKEIVPGYFVTIDDSQTISVGETTIIIPGSHQEWVPEKYAIFVAYRNEQDKKERAYFYVSKSEYEFCPDKKKANLGINAYLGPVSLNLSYQNDMTNYDGETETTSSASLTGKISLK